MELLNRAGEPTSSFQREEPVRIRLRDETTRRVERPNFVLVIRTVDGIALTGASSAGALVALPYGLVYSSETKIATLPGEG